MKVKPAALLTKHHRWISCLWLFTASWAHGQNYQPAAVQQPAYRQGGSAYVPPGVNRSTTQQRLPSAPANPPGYQPGFGTPQTYRPPTVKGSSTTKPKATTPTSKPKPASLEHKVARLERNDAMQDRRLNGLERGTGTSHVAESSSRPIATEGKMYTVRTGDTLWRIADKHHTSVNALKSANRLSGEVISVGQTLLIPGYGESAPLASNSASASGSYVVRPGDTFSQIARTHGVTQDALARANPSAYADRLLIGEKLTIPGKRGASSTVSTAPASSHTATHSSRAHVVKRGESLGAIAKSYGIPTATLASANHLKNANLIEPGQRLIIPNGGTKSSLSVPTYKPADSDTEPLADKYLASTPAVPKPLPATAPIYTSEPAPEPVSKPASTVSSNRRGIVAYRLERGDDINTVSALFNTSPETIRSLNKLPADKKLKEGDEVVVPALGAVSLN